MLRTIQLVSLLATAVFAAKKVEAPPPPSSMESMLAELKGCATDVLEALLGAAGDLLGYICAVPRFATDLFTWGVSFVRALPSLLKNVFDGDQKTLEELAGFCVTVGSVCFVVYISVAALNMGLQTLHSVKEYLAAYLTLPAMKKVLGVNVPKPITQARDWVQKQVLDRIVGWKFAFVMPLSGETGAPSTTSMITNAAAAVSLCMMLACAPAVLALMQGGPSKAGAEAVAWTMGTALGIQYLVGKAK